MRFGLRLTVFLLIVSVSVVMLYLPYVEIKEKTVTDMNEKQLLLAQQAAGGIESFFREQRKILQHFASSPFFVRFGPEAEKAIRHEYNQSFKHLLGITIYDTKGEIVYSYPSPEKYIGRDISGQAHVSEVIYNHLPNISDVFNAIQGYQAIALTEPIFEDKVFVGAVAFLIDFKFIARTFLENIRIGDDGYAWMLSRDGTELYCPVPGHTGRNVMETSADFPTVLSMADEMMKGKTGTTVYEYDMVKDSRAEKIVKHAAYAPVHILNNFWSVVVATPEKEMYKSLSTFYQKLMIFMVIFVIALLLFAYVLVREYGLTAMNKELERRVEEEVEKTKEQSRLMMQQARFYSMTETLNAIAHQWRQPLNVVGLCIQEIEETYAMDDVDKAHLDKMVKVTMEQLNGLSKTIDNFKNFFATSETAENIDVCKVLLKVHDVTKVQYDDINIDFRVLVDDRELKSEADCIAGRFAASIYPDLLKQAVLNCLQNSKEAILDQMKKGNIAMGKITLSLGKSSDGFLIEITDNGGGLTPEVLEKAFDPYFSTKGVSVGLGLGLYVTKDMLEQQMKGTITLQNIPGGTKALIRFKSL